jgi:hypothetical protein
VLLLGGVGWLQTRSLALLYGAVLYEGDKLLWSFYQLDSEYLRVLVCDDHAINRKLMASPAGPPGLGCFASADMPPGAAAALGPAGAAPA